MTRNSGGSDGSGKRGDVNPADGRRACPVCHSTSTETILHLGEVPVLCNVLWDSRSAALGCPKGEIELVRCARCGFIHNARFDETRIDYTPEYDNSLHFSPHFQRYALELASHLIERFDLRGKTVIEVGCGKGDFLAMLCRDGMNHGLGFDPSYIAPQGEAHGDHIEFFKEYYSGTHAEHGGDFLCCRHVLEHIAQPHMLLDRVQAGLRSGIPVYFEVPNAAYTLRHVFVWDVIYEHPSYFASNSLQRLFEKAGFEVLGVAERFDGQYLGIEARTGRGHDRALALDSDGEDESTAFAERFASLRRDWDTRVAALVSGDSRVVVWGAGSKGVTFLNLVPAADSIEYAVDLNPQKHGRYVAGSGQKVVPPAFLMEYAPDSVVVMNAVYADEIEEAVRKMGLHCDVLCL